MATPPTEVYVTDVVQRDVPVYLELVGQTQGFQDVEIRARVEGFLETVNFREGTLVRKGDLLYEIDRKPLEAILSAAKAELATSEARLEKAKNDVARYTPLAAKQAVSQQELDNAKAARDAETAQVEAGKAAVDKATLDLSYTRITSPIDGLAGITQVKPGNLVGRGESTLLTTISQINPVLFRVAATEADYLRFSRRLGERAPTAAPRARASSSRSPTAARTRTLAASTWSIARSIRRPAPWGSSWSTPIRICSCGPGSTAAPGCCSTPGRGRCWCRSGPSRNCRT